jgi:hypothetical protein
VLPGRSGTTFGSNVNGDPSGFSIAINNFRSVSGNEHAEAAERAIVHLMLGVYKRALVAPLAVVLIGCSGYDPTPEEVTADLQAETKSLLSALEDGDTDSFCATLTEGPRNNGKRPCEKRYARHKGSGIADADIEILNNTSTTPVSRVTTTAGTTQYTWKRIDDDWRVIIVMDFPKKN